ncbi:MAG: hypothetical protein K2P04_07735 [Oscillospiraceae bacterium]|jgi:hypothetical protein|nr:hypothetical protein [Oscillospiraceae bacterium]MDE6997749.1 hypothetical protein [Oscillospiraceae bacterium]
MIEWLAALFDNRVFMKTNAWLGFLFLGYFIYFYFSKEGRDERGRQLVATASLIAFVMLFFLLNIFAYCVPWCMDNVVRMANGLQTVYTLFLLTADIALLVLRKVK